MRGHARLMKPNFARLTFDRIAEPAYPNLIGSDGTLAYTFVPGTFVRLACALVMAGLCAVTALDSERTMVPAAQHPRNRSA